MDKINYINHFINPDSNVKKAKSKKKKLNSSDTFFTSKDISTFDEILNDAYTEETGSLNNEKNGIDNDKIEGLLKEIGKQGEKLKKSKHLEDLDQYKKMIKEYLNLILEQSEKVEQKSLWDKNKKQKITKVHLQIINSELLELTKIFFSEQQNTFAIAAKIDRIEGLLVDLKS
jgi:uncharacterized protein